MLFCSKVLSLCLPREQGLCVFENESAESSAGFPRLDARPKGPSFHGVFLASLSPGNRRGVLSLSTTPFAG